MISARPSTKVAAQKLYAALGDGANDAAANRSNAGCHTEYLVATGYNLIWLASLGSPESRRECDSALGIQCLAAGGGK